MSKSIVDVLIIGGGIAGVGCAAMLPGHLSVVLLEAETQCGYHATGRSAAAWIAGYGGPEIRVLTLESYAYLSNPPSSVSETGFLAPRGEMVLASSVEEERELVALLDVTPDLVEISLAQALAKVPILNTERLIKVGYTSDAHDIDADRLLQAWLKTLSHRGVQVLTGQPVTALRREDGFWLITAADGHTWRARKVVNASGAWADSVASLAGLEPIGLTPHRRSAALLPSPATHEVSDWPLIVSAGETWYARPTGGKLMVSPADETPVSPHDAFAEDMTIAEGLDRFERAVTFEVDRVETTWAGLRTFAKDKVPVMGEDPRMEGFFWLAGQGGYGIQTSPALSEFAARMLSGQALTLWQEELLIRLSPARLLSA